MSQKHIEILAGCTMPTRFESGQVIFRAGEPANGFYLIENGTVVLEERHEDGETVVIDVVAVANRWDGPGFSLPTFGNSMPAPRDRVAPLLFRYHAAAASRRRPLSQP